MIDAQAADSRRTAVNRTSFRQFALGKSGKLEAVFTPATDSSRRQPPFSPIASAICVDSSENEEGTGLRRAPSPGVAVSRWIDQ